MSRKKPVTLLSVGLLLLAIGLVAWLREEDQRSFTPGRQADPVAPELPEPAPHPASENTQPLILQPTTPARIYLLPDAAEIARRLNSGETSPQEDLEIVELLLTIFRKANNGLNPDGGLNEEIAGALAGKNFKGFAVLPPDHPAFAKNGELLDRWGAPYFFHPVTSRQIDVRSAGPDRALWTEDDVVLEVN
ncbi:hypothetical protein JIN84_07035 [Luteolibacter yonseiensis]|uniref:Type II secretion system protein GspG C-terminal domain-containing protein n=1 Tax=Luteolibacter yonseiensis TaxID=1144680 RepID=A0A934VAY1_9BACT|nr:hypothetical protein [Luteolibacter yonseiensis]MBK1815361.1 hypothetical protein [Luteolibacter yonseiensis]